VPMCQEFGTPTGQSKTKIFLRQRLIGRAWRIRTADQRIKSPLLYQLS
jgi:hypothetical protein